jgi:hypothetical protein
LYVSMKNQSDTYLISKPMFTREIEALGER